MAGRFFNVSTMALMATAPGGAAPLIASLLAAFDKSCSIEKASSLPPTSTKLRYCTKIGDLLMLDLGPRFVMISANGAIRRDVREQTQTEKSWKESRVWIGGLRDGP
jgi:hypothetical protein